MNRYKREAEAAGRSTWCEYNYILHAAATNRLKDLSWALDLTTEERSKGKTVEVGRGFFETDKRRYSILDAPVVALLNFM